MMSQHLDLPNLRLLLQQLEVQWRRLGAPIAGRLRAGATDAHLDDLATSRGLPLPPELRIWWKWHDGADLDPANGGYTREIGPGGYQFLTAAEAFDAYDQNRQIHGDAADPSVQWKPSWLPFMTVDAERLYVDCANVRTPEYASPVRLVSWEWEYPDVDRTVSLTQAVALWVWLLEGDNYRWNGPSDPLSDCDRTKLPLFVRMSRLA